VNVLKWILFSVILAEVIILEVGLYYAVIKAGIPYQDPTTELQFRYTVNMGIGETLIKIGAVMFSVGTLFRIVVGLISRKQDKRTVPLS
jgi:hypothetical protein